MPNLSLGEEEARVATAVSDSSSVHRLASLAMVKRARQGRTFHGRCPSNHHRKLPPPTPTLSHPSHQITQKGNTLAFNGTNQSESHNVRKKKGPSEKKKKKRSQRKTQVRRKYVWHRQQRHGVILFPQLRTQSLTSRDETTNKKHFLRQAHTLTDVFLFFFLYKEIKV